MSRIESGKIDIRNAQFNIRDVVLDCYNLLISQTEERGLLFEHFIAPDVVLDVVGDVDRIRQVIINLLTNSCKFTESGGKLTLAVNSAPYPDLAENHAGKLFVAFSVEDTGIGMSEEFLSKIFNPFEQEEQYLQRKYKGTGLGLSICHRLAVLMGGNIKVVSELSVGSKFTFTLPLERGVSPEKAENGAAKEEAPVDFSNVLLLLVDDIEMNRLIMAESLADTKIEIVEASDGDEAVQIFADSKEGEFDIIFMDVQMPRMDGYQATEAIRALPRRDAATIPIVAMTANAMREDVEQALTHGMTRHLAKPIDIDDCVRAISELT
jgi:CheY-like chemotaxis protein